MCLVREVVYRKGQVVSNCSDCRRFLLRGWCGFGFVLGLLVAGSAESCPVVPAGGVSVLDDLGKGGAKQ